MEKKQGQRPTAGKLTITKTGIITISSAVAAISLLAYFEVNAINSISGNVSGPGSLKNNLIKAMHSHDSGFVYVSQSPHNKVNDITKIGEGGNSGSGRNNNYINPTYTVIKGVPQSIRVVNEDYDTHSKHNLNIREFNVHTRDLKYFETETVTFTADKVGKFEYYCTIHPEMRGIINVVQQQQDLN